MVKAKRNERIAVITRILCENPGKLFNLSYFSSLLGATKSSLSEDIAGLKELFEVRGLGRIETLPGAAGGVRYIPVVSDVQQEEYLLGLAQTLSDSRRALSGGYIYMADLMNNPEQLGCMAQAMIRPFVNKKADFILTMETKGIPIALMTARALNLPLVVARRENRINEGPQVTINYLSGSGKSMQAMSLPRRAVSAGKPVCMRWGCPSRRTPRRGTKWPIPATASIWPMPSRIPAAAGLDEKSPIPSLQAVIREHPVL